MKLLIQFLFIGGILIIISEADPRQMKKIIKDVIKLNIPNISSSTKHNLTLNAIVSISNHAIVSRGFFDKIPVAIKITWNKMSIDREMRIFNALNAIENPNIEYYGIPNVYYHGPVIIGGCYAIAMTLFDETIEDRYAEQDEQFSDLSILLILKRAIEILEYLHIKNVIHNDIKPDNMFLRRSEVFIGDFDCAALHGEYAEGHTAKYASSRIFMSPTPKRYERDDLESLVYVAWYFAGCDSLRSDGYELLENKKEGKAKEKIMEKCEHFKNDDVRTAFNVILAEMISENDVPNYKGMIDALAAAIEKVNESLTPPQFEWLQEDMSSDSANSQQSFSSKTN